MMMGKSKQILLTLLTLLSTTVFAAVHTQYDATVCGTGKYLFGCDVLTASGNKSKTLGDSTVTVHLLFAPLKATAYSATIEPGQSYLFGCNVLTADATESNTLQQAGCTCDSTVTLTLSVKAPPVPVPDTVMVEYNAEINSGEKYLFGCRILDTEGTYADTLAGVGRDSVVLLHLSFAVVPPTPTPDTVKVEYNAEINSGEKYLFGCRILTAEGAYSDTLKGAARDSVVTLHLKYAVVPPTPADTVKVEYNAEINSGEKYLFGCRILTDEGAYSDTLKGVARDSVVTLHLKYAVVPPQDTAKVEYTADIKPKEKYLFGCRILDTKGTYADTLKGAARDSVVILHLNILNDTTYGEITDTVCDSLVWYEHVCKTSDDYKHTFVGGNYYGGDSILTLHLTVNHSIDTTITDPINVCDSYNWKGAGLDTTITTDGTYTHKFQTVTGCDSIVTITVKIYPSYNDTIWGVSGCGSYHWKNAEIDTVIKTAGTHLYSHTFYSKNGCDSVVTLQVTINPTYNDTIKNLEGCESYTYQWTPGVDTVITATGIYTHPYQTVHGCDSLVSLDVTIYHAADTTYLPKEKACESYTHQWIAGVDTVITTSGIYTHTYNTIHGCDSVVSLEVDIHHAADTTKLPLVEKCDSYTYQWIPGVDTVITTSGTYTHMYKTVHGCDSVVALPVAIYTSYNVRGDSVNTCNLYRWKLENNTDTIIATIGSHDYTHVFPSVHGCDSVVTINVTISVPYVDTLDVKAYYGYRIIMINRHQINSLWANIKLDSLGLEHPEYVVWYQMLGATPDSTDRKVATGYYYTLPSGEPLPAGNKYYAVIDIAPKPGLDCGALGRTEIITIGTPAYAPALRPSLAKPGQEIEVVNLDPAAKTTIRVYSADGVLQKTMITQGEESCTIQAAKDNGFYLVELFSDDMKSTLRYIVQ